MPRFHGSRLSTSHRDQHLSVALVRMALRAPAFATEPPTTIMKSLKPSSFPSSNMVSGAFTELNDEDDSNADYTTKALPLRRRSMETETVCISARTSCSPTSSMYSLVSPWMPSADSDVDPDEDIRQQEKIGAASVSNKEKRFFGMRSRRSISGISTESVPVPIPLSGHAGGCRDEVDDWSGFWYANNSLYPGTYSGCSPQADDRRPPDSPLYGLEVGPVRTETCPTYESECRVGCASREDGWMRANPEADNSQASGGNYWEELARIASEGSIPDESAGHTERDPDSQEQGLFEAEHSLIFELEM